MERVNAGFHIKTVPSEQYSDGTAHSTLLLTRAFTAFPYSFATPPR